MSDTASLGIEAPLVLLPNDRVDLGAWAVVATDQYTSQPEYWERVDAAVGERPSTLRLILPEVYLGQPDVQQRIDAIHAAMRRYLADGVLAQPVRGFIVVDRKTSHAPTRKGLIVALDLEHYEFKPGSTSLVRATEKTVEERLPPRVEVRRGALLELPHVMVLIDDAERSVIEPLVEALASSPPLYETELMEGGGAIRAWRVTRPEHEAAIVRALAALAAPAAYRARYGAEGEDVLLYAVGDGNHSLAAAKVHWEALRSELSAAELEGHPARFALVELVNVHDDGLIFEPIHRVAFGVDPASVLEAMPAHFADLGGSCSVEDVADPASWQRELERAWSERGSEQVVGFVTAGRRGILRIQGSGSNLPVGSLQVFLDAHLPAVSGSSLDYIHGRDVLESLSSGADRLGFFLPAMHKSELFETVIKDGVLPRKTFSMGEAEEKRFYLEARRIER